MIGDQSGKNKPVRYFEDYVPGTTEDYGSISVTESEIIAFGSKFDPQVFHTDPEASTHTIYKGLIASGWHTSAMAMRLIVEHYLSPETSLGSPGVSELQWPIPVRPGDSLSIRVHVVETRRSRSKPDRGLVTSYVQALNQNGEIVMTMRAVNFVLCRGPNRTDQDDQVITTNEKNGQV